MATKTLNIITLNIGSLVFGARKVFLLDFVGDNDPDVVLLCETHIRRDLGLSGLKVFCWNEGQGVAVVVKNSFPINPVFFKLTVGILR